MVAKRKAEISKVVDSNAAGDTSAGVETDQPTEQVTMVVDLVTHPPSEVQVNAAVPKGRAKGGYARAAKLSSAERSAQAGEAANQRWKNRGGQPDSVPKVIKGYSNVLNLAGTRVPCAVISGPNGVQRVLSETGITQAILRSRSGASKRLKTSATDKGDDLPLFLAPSQLDPYITEELRAGPLRRIDYEDEGGRIVTGYDASVLVSVCTIWLKAREDGVLQKQQLRKAQYAERITLALAETGIVALIDEATGYEKVRPQGALQAYLEQIIRKDLAAWVKVFPDEFYENIYKLRGWAWPGMSKNRFSPVAQYTKDLIYSRLGPGILEELQKKTPRNEKGERRNRFHQWFTADVGSPLLAQHMHAIVMMQRLAIANGYGWSRFMTMINQVFPKKDSNLLTQFDQLGQSPSNDDG